MNLSPPLERTISQQSHTSARSRNTSRRPAAKKQQPPSSSASSVIGGEDSKSLTSFPSFSPREEETCCFLNNNQQEEDSGNTPLPPPSSTIPSRKPSTSLSEIDQQPPRLEPEQIIPTLLTTPHTAGPLFEDSPPCRNRLPGALHHADDGHIERLIARQGGAVNLVRQIAEDLAARDAQIALLRRRADERERALRKIILECGLSNLDLETRLRVLLEEGRSQRRQGSGEELEDLIGDALEGDVRLDATIKGRVVKERGANTGQQQQKGTGRGWKEYLWGGTGTSKGDGKGETTAVKGGARQSMPEDWFKPPAEQQEEQAQQSSSRASSVSSAHAARKPSLASMALRLVAGGAAGNRDNEGRGRASSAAAAQAGGPLRGSSTSSAKTTASNRAVSVQAGGPKALMQMRRTTAGGSTRPMDIPARGQVPERWDTMGASPGKAAILRHQSYGPVEMDTILPPEAQPPTLTHIYNNFVGSEYLTDRFGFIYDQRRKKRQREAAQMAKQGKRGSRTEMLTNGRGGMSPVMAGDDDGANSGRWDVLSESGRPDTPCSGTTTEEQVRGGGGNEENAKPKRWQDYLKIATFPTELLSHTPLISAQGFEVLEGGEVPPPKSPGHSPSIMSEERGFLPSATTTTVSIAPMMEEHQEPVVSSVSSSSVSAPAGVEEEDGGTPPGSTTPAKEDAEPVRLLLENLNRLHDSLQRERTVRWNEFLRKVRAERKRDGEAAAAAAAAAAEARFQRATAIMPETRLGDGELIGVASLGVQGKVGRAKATEFRSLLLGGIPVAMRAKIWSECSGAKALRIPGYYEDLVSRPGEEDDPQVVAQIKADITRTLTDNIFFRKGPGVGKLHEVLLAYSRRNPDVGYCQGMNLVVANLLLITPSSEDAFWILVATVEQILPSGYFDHSLLASRADQVVLRQYVSEVLPKLSAHFDDLGIDLETMTFQWFLSIFTDCLSAEALFRVWDVVLCTPHDGGAFLFQVALALLKLNEGQLLGCGSPAGVYTYINHQMTNHAISIDGLVQASEGLRRLVKKEDIEARRERAIELEREQVRLREERLAERRRVQQQDKVNGKGGNNSRPRALKKESSLLVLGGSGGGGGRNKAGAVPAVVSGEMASGATTPSGMGSLSRVGSACPSPMFGPERGGLGSRSVSGSDGLLSVEGLMGISNGGGGGGG
ncbi:Putative small G protein signaling modulator [Podospora comata]|uniref:Small G protein signaling modulator n=1 Tax=Podospora comata TaxID=48703 RepID=A0ABY6S6S0_PODCO|nr:Putative small G protein signaling modulator [Podospora comata]